jgi:hypothetical protein
MSDLGKYKNSSVAIMQPYFFPYLGYFSLIKHTDFWIAFDSVQYIRRGWMNRNRILAPEKPNGGWQYISVPIRKAQRETLIKDIKINNDIPWQEIILRQLQHYKKKAPYFYQVMELLTDAFSESFDDISHLNTHLLLSVCDYLSIAFDFEIYSEMDFPDMNISHPGDWALGISKHLYVSRYINPPGGQGIFSKDEWKSSNIQLRFLSSNLPHYSQRRKESIMGLSIIDVMMFNSQSDISTMLDDITIS